MTNRDFLKQISTDELPDAATVLSRAQKPSSIKRRITVLAVATAMLVGIVGTAYAKSSSEAAETAKVVADVANSIEQSLNSPKKAITLIGKLKPNGDGTFSLDLSPLPLDLKPGDTVHFDFVAPVILPSPSA